MKDSDKNVKKFIAMCSGVNYVHQKFSIPFKNLSKNMISY